MNNSIISGSIGAIAKQNNKSIAESFINAECIVIIDTSGSMGIHDSLDNNSRYDAACEQLAQLQNNLPGKIAVLSFSDSVMFNPDGRPFYYGSGTDLAGALRFAKIADVPDMRFILISDGEPNDRSSALDIAAQYNNKIDVIYVGSETSPIGRDFLEKLARRSGGTVISADRAINLLQSAERLLLKEGGHE